MSEVAMLCCTVTHVCLSTLLQKTSLIVSSVIGGRTSRPMKPSGEAKREAMAFLGLLRHNEDLLVVQTKHLLKKNRQLVHDVFTTKVDEWTPLHACTLRGARKLVKIAMKAGVNPNLEMGLPDGLPGRCTPLHLAAYRGDVSIIQLLLQHGAAVNRLDSTNRSPLFYAASKNNTFAAKKLIKHGAEVKDLTYEQLVFYSEVIERRPPSFLCIPPPSRSGRSSAHS